jgi:tetratricopeptide (TPR) repeat protein
MNRFPTRSFTLALTVLLGLSLAGPALANSQHNAQPDSWGKLSERLRGVARTYAKWGITFEVESKELAGSAGILPSYLQVSGGYTAADTVQMDVEAGLGQKEAMAVAISGSFKIGPDGNALSGGGTVSLKGSGLGTKFKYDREEGLSFEVGLEETFYTLGIKIGGDGRSPLSLGLKGGPVKIKIDPVKWVSQCRTFLPEAAKAAEKKVGGVLIRTDMSFLAAALADAPPPDVLQLRDVTVVSLKRLLTAVKAGTATNLGPVTSVIGLVLDSESGDVLLIGRAEANAPAIPVSFLSAILRSVWRDKRDPFVSLNPQPTGDGLKLLPQVGGVSPGLEASPMVATMLEADYRMKSVLYGDTLVEGITPVPQAMSRANSVWGTASARFWFTPRPLESGDVCVLKSARGAIYTFNSQPMVMTETMARTGGSGLGGFGGAEGDVDPMESVLKRAAVELTRYYGEMERTQPEMRLKPLRQVFELATLAAILRKEPPSTPCAALLKQVAELPVAAVSLPASYTPIEKTLPIPGTQGGAKLWGGVNTDAGLRDAQFRLEWSLADLLDRVQAASWRGWSVRLTGAFDPVIADAEMLTKAQLAQPHLRAAELNLRQRNLPAALGEIDSALEMNPDSAQAWLLRAATHFIMRRPPSMLDDAQKAVKLSPKDWRAHYWRGLAYNELRRVPESLADAEEAVRLAPTSVEAYMLRAAAKRDGGDARGAVEDLTTALKYGPQKSFIFQQRGISWMQAGNKEKAIADFTAAVGLNPRDVTSYRERGYLYGELRDYERSVADYARITEVQPTSKHFSDLSGARMYTKDFRGALRDANRAVELDDGNGWGYAGRAMANQELGEYAKAIEDYEIAIRLLPDLRVPLQRRLDDCRKRLEGP